MEREFFIESKKHNGWYCTKCGKRQLRDRYNLEKHVESCWGSRGSDALLIREDEDFCYWLEDRSDRIALIVGTPSLACLPGFADRFRGYEFDRLFEEEFVFGEKSPRILYDRFGLKTDGILGLISEGKIRCIGAVKDEQVICRVFPGLLGVISIKMFAHIYRNKGFGYTQALPQELEKKLLSPLGYDRQLEDAEGDPEKRGIPLLVTDYLYRKKVRILRAAFRRNGRTVIFLFSRGYAACNRAGSAVSMRISGAPGSGRERAGDRRDGMEPGGRINIGDLFGKRFWLISDSKSSLRRFEHSYPEFLLEQYMERSDNVLVPLLAADYHKGIELAAKAGAAAVAENYRYLEAFERDPDTYKNLKELFGLSPSVLRALNRNTATDANIRRMEEIGRYNPQLLRFDDFTPSMLEFMHRADITHEGKGNMIRATQDLTDRQYLQVLKYLKKHPDEGHYYCDYLNACATLGEQPYGLTPGVPIREAHDRTVARIRNNHNELLKRNFVARVCGEEYLSLTTDLTEEDMEYFDEDPYVIMAPEASDDLFMESENMHNCVRIYTERVAEGACRIYFLREKKSPEKSFGTIEVSGNGRSLYQAKGFANNRLGRRAQKFVLKWCKARNIRICTADISKAG